MDISLARKTEIYFIIERLFPRDHLVPGTLTLGLISPSITQIHRTVIRLMVKQNMYMDGERIHPGDISLWQRVKYLFGSVVSTKDTENFVYHLAYSGSLIAATPFPASAIIDIPKRLTTPIIKQVPGYMTMGTDPIPNITLYNKENIKFFMGNGGINTPTAMAKYNGISKEINIIDDKIILQNMMFEFQKQGAER